MREVLRIIYRGSTELRFMIGVEILGIIMLVLMVISFWIYGQDIILVDHRILALGVLVILLGFMFVTAPCVWLFRSINAIRKFKKEFGFLPPVTPEERDAKQRVVDNKLARAAETFSVCDIRERDLLKELNSFSEKRVNNASIDDFLAKVDYCQDGLRLAKVDVLEAKRHFWNLHAIASSSYLPQPFKVLEKRDDYKNVTFETPAKYEKDKSAWSDVPSRGQGG